MSEDITKALNRRAELLKELEDIDRLIELYERYIGPVAGSEERVGNTSESIRTRHRRRPTRKTGAAAAIAKAAEATLWQHRRPIQRGELAELIENSGTEIPSEDKPRYLGTVLWRRQDLFENIEGQGYILRNDPPAGIQATPYKEEAEESEKDDSPTGD